MFVPLKSHETDISVKRSLATIWMCAQIQAISTQMSAFVLLTVSWVVLSVNAADYELIA